MTEVLCKSCPAKWPFPATHIANAYGANKDEYQGRQLDWPVCAEHVQFATVAGWFPIRALGEQANDVEVSTHAEGERP